MNIRYLFIITILYLNISVLQAQLYDTAAGIRLGVPLSLSYKKIINENKALEGYLGTRGNGDFRFINLSGAYQIIQPIDIGGIEELYYYYGVGASIYFWNFKEEGPNQSVTPGIQGYLGVEYTFEDRPINLTLDWIPSLFLSGELSGLQGGYFAIGVRYVLSRNAESTLDTK